MPVRFLTYSTSKPGGSSAGVSATDFTTQCTRSQFNVFDQTYGIESSPFLVWYHETPDALFTHTVSLRPYLEKTADEPDMPEFVLARIICHRLLDFIPDRALPELCESMKNIFEFYVPPTSRQSSLQSKTRMRARLGKGYVRPEFHIAEE